MSSGKVGLALGSGGAKGFAHVGVLKALEENGVQVEFVSGSSMGSLVGAFYATGMRPDFMDRLARTLSWRHWVDVTVPRVGLIAGKRIHEMVTLLTRGVDFSKTNIPLAIVSTELMTRRLVTFTTGRVSDAVRASISIPGVFVPYVRDDGVFVDGGVMERVPISAVKALGARRVIAVDVATVMKDEVPSTMLDVIMLSLDAMMGQLLQHKLPTADVFIAPDLSDIGTSQFHRAAEAIEIGYEATLAAMDRILELTQVDSSAEEETP